MDHSLTQALVRTILEHAEDFPWRMQEIGLLGLRLDDRREHRLHVWGPAYSVGEPPVHDHPYNFVSTVVVGEMTNTRYVEDPEGVEYQRVRYSPADEDARDHRLRAVVRDRDMWRAGRASTRKTRTNCTTVARYRARSPSSGWPSSTSPALTVCTKDARWVSAQARPATPAEVKAITGATLESLRVNP